MTYEATHEAPNHDARHHTSVLFGASGRGPAGTGVLGAVLAARGRLPARRARPLPPLTPVARDRAEMLNLLTPTPRRPTD